MQFNTSTGNRNESIYRCTMYVTENLLTTKVQLSPDRTKRQAIRNGVSGARGAVSCIRRAAKLPRAHPAVQARPEAAPQLYVIVVAAWRATRTSCARLLGVRHAAAGRRAGGSLGTKPRTALRYEWLQSNAIGHHRTSNTSLHYRAPFLTSIFFLLQNQSLCWECWTTYK